MPVRVEIWLYRLLALLSLAGTWTFNIRLALEGGTLADFLRQAFANNPVASLSTDIFICGGLLVPWMLREGRRYGIKHLWAYVFFGLTIAISVTVPLFLAARRKAVAAQGEKRGVTKLTAAYPIVAGVAFVLVNYWVVMFAREVAQGVPWQVFFQSWFWSNGAGSLAVDLLGLSASLLVFLFAEARAGRVRHFVGYVAMCAFGVAFALPWFLRALDVGAPVASARVTE